MWRIGREGERERGTGLVILLYYVTMKYNYQCRFGIYCPRAGENERQTEKKKATNLYPSILDSTSELERERERNLLVRNYIVM